jgi:hypothetical protein
MAVVSIKNKLRRGNLLAGNDAFIPNSFESIATVTASGTPSSIDLTSIPGTYQHLQLRIFAQQVGQGWNMYFNSDTTSANYADHYLESYADGSGVLTIKAAGSTSNAILMNNSSFTDKNNFPSVWGGLIIDIHDYASTTKYKTMRYFGGWDANSSAGYSSCVSLGSLLWENTAAITSIKWQGNGITNGSTFALYGIKGA